MPNQIGETTIVTPHCEDCGEETEALGVCPIDADGCQNTKELCGDCLFQHMTDKHGGG